MTPPVGSPARERARALAQDLALGLAAAMGQAPLGLWPVALAGFALALRRVAGAGTPGAALRRGWGIGAGYFGFSLFWILQPFFVDPWRHGWLAPFALMAVAVGFGLFWAVAGWAARRLGGGAVTLALTLSAVELARGHVLTGFPWALPGHIWLDTPLIQTGALTGAYGMTALTLLALAVPLTLGRRGLWAPVLIGGAAAGWAGYRLSLPEPAARPGIVRLVQPDIAQSLKWDPDEARANFDTLLTLTRGSGADLVIWPETAVPYLLEEGQGAALAIAEAGGAATVAAGIQRDQGAQAWNTLAVFGPGGFITQSFDKVHLVPFGEYIPMGDLVFRWTGLRAFASQAGAGYTAGTDRRLLDFGAHGRALPVICYEAIFPEELVTAERPDWIIMVTNDAWFGTLTGPYQHFAQARLRAVELGLPLLRAANTGISAVVDARGRIATAADGSPALLGLGQRGVIDAALPGALPLTPYARIGDWPLAGLLLAGLAFCAIRARRWGSP